MRRLIALVVIVFLATLCKAEDLHPTISLDSLPYFLGQFEVTTQDHTVLTAWMYDTVDNRGRRWSERHLQSSSLAVWCFLDTTGQKEIPYLRYQHTGSMQDTVPLLSHRFFVMQDVGRYAGYGGVLTVWRLTDDGRATMHCAYNENDDGFSGARVERVTHFPDSSALMIVRWGGGDGGDAWGGYRFYRSTDLCNFDLIYSSSWKTDMGWTDNMKRSCDLSLYCSPLVRDVN